MTRVTTAAVALLICFSLGVLRPDDVAAQEACNLGSMSASLSSPSLPPSVLYSVLTPRGTFWLSHLWCFLLPHSLPLVKYAHSLTLWLSRVQWCR